MLLALVYPFLVLCDSWSFDGVPVYGVELGNGGSDGSWYWW